MWRVGDKFEYKKNIYSIDFIDFYLGCNHYFAYRWQGDAYIFGCFYENDLKPVKGHYEQLLLF